MEWEYPPILPILKCRIMHKDIKINIRHITRVEGHGNVVIDIKKGLIKELRLEIVESPRFYEAMLRGRKYDEAQHIMSRICGICAVSQERKRKMGRFY
jgi:coenzyme F420-reducing hydrogenase alpha subunit